MTHFMDQNGNKDRQDPSKECKKVCGVQAKEYSHQPKEGMNPYGNSKEQEIQVVRCLVGIERTHGSKLSDIGFILNGNPALLSRHIR